MQRFTNYNGFGGTNTMMQNFSTGGKRTIQEEYDLWLQSNASNYDMNGFHTPNRMAAQLRCYWCQGNHYSEDCQVGNPYYQPHIEPAYYGDHFHWHQNNAYSNSYDSEWRNNPNCSWWNNQQMEQPLPQSGPQPNNRLDKLDEAILEMTNKTNQLDAEMEKFIKCMDESISRIDSINQRSIARAQESEALTARLANLLASHPQDNMMSELDVNPKEEYEETFMDSDEELEAPSTVGIQESTSQKNIMEVPAAPPMAQVLPKEQNDLNEDKSSTVDIKCFPEETLVNQPLCHYSDYLEEYLDPFKDKSKEVWELKRMMGFTHMEQQKLKKNLAVEKKFIYYLKPQPLILRHVFKGDAYENAKLYKERCSTWDFKFSLERNQVKLKT